MQYKKGFSIGEVLIAMFILLVGMVDAVFLTVRSVDTMKDSRDAVVATLLAQEGTELVRNVRDNNVTELNCASGRCTAFETSGSHDYDLPSSGFNGYCTIDYDTNTNDPELCCSGGSCEDELFLDEATEMYEHSSGGSSRHKIFRRIYIDYEATGGAAPDNVIAKVTSVVIFGGRDDFPNANTIEDDCKISEKCVFAQTRLTSWINYGD